MQFKKNWFSELFDVLVRPAFCQIALSMGRVKKGYIPVFGVCAIIIITMFSLVAGSVDVDSNLTRRRIRIASKKISDKSTELSTRIPILTSLHFSIPYDNTNANEVSKIERLVTYVN